MNGRLQRTQFTQAVQELDTRIRTVTNEVSTGNYPQLPHFSCSINGSGFPVVSASGSPTDTQGTNTDCTFAGKIINFTPKSANCTDPADASHCTTTEVYTVVGRRIDSTGKQVVTQLLGVNGAHPTVITDPDNAFTFNLGYGTRVTGVYLKTTPTLTKVSAIGFFQTYAGSYSESGLSSGSQSTETRLISGSQPLDKIEMAAQVANEANIGPANPSQGALICLSNDGGDQKGSITLGADNSGFSSRVLIGDPLCP